jgi:Zn-dependent protease/predicted transcriptional regulator
MFGSSLTLFRIFGLDIKVNLSWAFIALLISWSLASGYFPSVHEGFGVATYWAMGILAVAGIFLSILLHELAHSLVAIAYGIPMKGITLHMLGGAAEMEAEPPTPKAEALMALAGPLASVAIAAVLWGVFRLTGTADPSPFGILIRYLAMLNLLLAVFNMLPAFPLDGGRVLRAGVWAATGDFARATRVASSIGAGLGFGLALLGVVQVISGQVSGGLWTILIGFFIRSAAMTSRVDLETRSMLTGQTVARFMTAAPVTVGPNVAVADFLENVVYKTRHDAYPVVDGSGAPRGLVAVGDLHGLPREEWATTPVTQVMRPVEPGFIVAPGDDAVAALDRMRDGSHSRLLVVEGGRLVGLLTLKDLLETLQLRMEFGAPAATPSRTP